MLLRKRHAHAPRLSARKARVGLEAPQTLVAFLLGALELLFLGEPQVVAYARAVGETLFERAAHKGFFVEALRVGEEADGAEDEDEVEETHFGSGAGGICVCVAWLRRLGGISMW